MKDLARRGIRGGVELGRLQRGQAFEYRQRKSAVEPKALQRRDQPVATERGRVPGNSRVGKKPLRGLGGEHRQVHGRAAEHFVETVVRGVDLSLALYSGIHLP